jgi:hypothetical protein
MVETVSERSETSIYSWEQTVDISLWNVGNWHPSLMTETASEMSATSINSWEQTVDAVSETSETDINPWRWRQSLKWRPLLRTDGRHSLWNVGNWHQSLMMETASEMSATSINSWEQTVDIVSETSETDINPWWWRQPLKCRPLASTENRQ